MSDTVAKILPSFEALRSELAALGPGWIERQDSDFFCTLDWFENLASNGFAEGPLIGEIRLLFGVNTQFGHAICLPLRLGAKLTGLSNYYCSLFGPIQWERTGAERSVDNLDKFNHEGTRLFAELIRQQLGAKAELQLAPLDIDSGFVTELGIALKKSSFWTDHFFCFGNWHLQVAQRSFEHYRAHLPSALQHSIDRGQRRLSKKGQWTIHLQTADDVNLDDAMADFISVYRQSWKQPEPRDDFIPSLIRLAAQKQWLRLGILRLQGRPVAAQIWIVKNAKASIFKLAYVEGFERFSPGSVLTAQLMRHVLDNDKVSEVDYLTGDDAYKADWMSHRRERWGIIGFFKISLTGNWQAAKHYVGRLRRYPSGQLLTS